MNSDARRYLPITVAAVVLVAVLILVYIAGYRAGRSSAVAHPTYNRVAR
jgi:hypothetical protein